MVIQQISVFLENKPGQLSELINTLAAKNINLNALSIAENAEYGVVRFTVDADITDSTALFLTSEGWICNRNHVLAVNVPDSPGSLVKILDVLAANGLSILYTYATISELEGHVCLIMRFDDNEKAIEVLKEAGIE